jgi:hypothetical protein
MEFSYLESKKERMTRKDTRVYVCAICGEEIPFENISGTIRGKLFDWEIKCVTYKDSVEFDICKKCYPDFLRRLDKHNALIEEQSISKQ